MSEASNYSRILKEIEAVKAPTGFLDQVNQRIDDQATNQTSNRKKPRRFIVVATAAAAALILASLLIWPPDFIQADPFEISHVYTMKKRGKGPGNMEKGGVATLEMKVQQVLDLVQMHQGSRIKIDRNRVNQETNFLRFDLPAENYSAFKADYQLHRTHYSLPDTLAANRRGMIRIQIGFPERQVWLGDFDGDGRGEIVSYSTRGNSVGRMSTSRNTNANTNTNTNTSANASANTNTNGGVGVRGGSCQRVARRVADGLTVVLPGEVNGDGVLDLLMISGSEKLVVRGLMAKELGQFRRGRKLFVSDQIGLGDGVWLAGDLNGDGYTDLVFRPQDGREGLRVLMNNSEMGFEEAVPLDLPNPAGATLLLLDINADDLDDVLVYHQHGVRNAQWFVYVNLGARGFSEEIQVSFGGRMLAFQGNYTPIAGDVNGDGYDDLMIKMGGFNEYSSWTVLLNNQQAGFDAGYALDINGETDLDF